MIWENIARKFLKENGVYCAESFVLHREVFSDHIDGGTLYGVISGNDVEVYISEGEPFDFLVYNDDSGEDSYSSVDANCDSLASAGWGTDEDYGDYEGSDW